MVVDFSKIDMHEKPTLILETPSGKTIQTLGYATNISADLYFNEVSKLSFSIPAYVDGARTPGYDMVEGMMVVYWLGVGRFIIVDPETTSEDIRKVKNCSCYSLEYELNRKKITIEEGTMKLWDPIDPDNTILKIVIDVLPGWIVGNVDSDLVGLYRTFDAENDNVYSFLKNKVQKSYNCIIDFDTIQKKINVISATAVSPLSPVYLSEQRLFKRVTVSENSDEIVTCLDVNGADGVDIRQVTPTGENKIYNLDHFMNTTHFDQSIIAKWNAWKLNFETNQELCFNLYNEMNLRTMQYQTEYAKLVDLRGELTSLENQQAVIVQAIMKKLKEQADLDAINDLIEAKNEEINEQEELLDGISQEESYVKNQITALKSSSSFSAYFSNTEIEILKSYFIEESIEESTFVEPNTNSYINSPLAGDAADTTLGMSGYKLEDITTDDRRIISLTDGHIVYGGITSDFSRASVEYTTSDDDESIVVTAYLVNGDVDDTEFKTGTLTITGLCEGTIISGDDIISIDTEFISGSRNYFTYDTTDYAKQAIAWDLYKYGKDILDKKSVPSYTFSVDSSNFLALDEFESFKNHFEFGNRVYVEVDGVVRKPYVVHVAFDFSDVSSFSIEFNSDYSSYDATFSLSHLLEQSVSMGKSLDVKGVTYNEFKASGANHAVLNFMNSALDVAKNTVMSSGEQAIEFGDSGIRVRQWDEDNPEEYDDNQIWIVNNCMAFTDDNWSTAKIAIGEIFDENFGTDVTRYQKTKDTSQVAGKEYFINIEGDPWDESTEWSTALYEKVLGGLQYGIAAPYIVGTLLAGSNLRISNESGTFAMDGDGVRIESADFRILHGTIASKKDGLGSGNVVFDGDGMWLINDTSMQRATKAVRLNENGISFGSGDAGHIKDSSSSEDWSWSTNINIDGVFADGKISGGEIIGTEIHVGARGTTPETYNFSVDRYGNMIANSGTFTGDIESSEISGSDIYGSNLYIGERGTTPKTYNFVVNSNGSLNIGPTLSTTSPYNFSVGTDGKIIAHSGTFDGTINGSTINSSSIYGGEYFSSGGFGRLTLDEMLNEDEGTYFPSIKYCYVNGSGGYESELFRVDGFDTTEMSADDFLYMYFLSDPIMSYFKSVAGGGGSLGILADRTMIGKLEVGYKLYGYDPPTENVHTSDEFVDGSIYFQIVSQTNGDN